MVCVIPYVLKSNSYSSLYPQCGKICSKVEFDDYIRIHKLLTNRGLIIQMQLSKEFDPIVMLPFDFVCFADKHQMPFYV